MTPDKEYPCTNCGSKNVQIVRKDQDNPKLKCGSCNFIFNGQDSVAAAEAGAIKASSSESLAGAEEGEVIHHSVSDEVSKPTQPQTVNRTPSFIPRSPTYVFISSARQVEFATQKTVKKVALGWEAAEVKYTLYELTEKKSVVKLDIS